MRRQAPGPSMLSAALADREGNQCGRQSGNQQVPSGRDSPSLVGLIVPCGRCSPWAGLLRSQIVISTGRVISPWVVRYWVACQTTHLGRGATAPWQLIG